MCDHGCIDAQWLEHRNWMRDNDPNTWAWLLPRHTLLADYSMAVAGANFMRQRAYRKMEKGNVL